MQEKPFWEKATIMPPLSWENWTKQRKHSLLAKEGNQNEILLKGGQQESYTPRTCTRIGCSKSRKTKTTERDRRFRNRQLKVTWQNRCKKTDKFDVLCGDKPWVICDQKCYSLLYVCNGTAGCKIFKR